MRYLFLLCLLLFAEKAQSQPPSIGSNTAVSHTAPFRVDDAVRIAVQNNPRLLAAAGLVRSAREGVRGAGKLTNPNVLLVLPTSMSGTDEVFLFQQPLEVNGSRSARTGIAAAGLKEREAQALTSLRSLVFETKAAYYELARAQAFHSLTLEVVKNAEEFDRVTRRLVELGTRPGIERTQTGLELSRARQESTLSKSRVETARAALNRLLGRTSQETTESTGALDALTPVSQSDLTGPEEESLIQKAVLQSSEVQREEAAREVYKQQARLARAKGRPDLSPQVRAQRFRTSGDDVGFGLALTLPLFDYGSRRAEINQAEIAAQSQALQIQDTQNQVRQEVTQALSRLRAAKGVVEGYQQGILGDAQKLLEANRTGVEAGAYSILSVLEAQRTYRTVQADYLSALTSLAIARAELERAAGEISMKQITPSEEAN